MLKTFLRNIICRTHLSKYNLFKSEQFLFPYFFLLFIFCISFHTSFSQSRKTDSLQNILKLTKDDTSRVNILNLLFLEEEFNDAVKANEYANEALELSQKIDYKKGLADSYSHLGFLAQDKSNCEQAGIYHKQSLKIAAELKDKKRVASSLCNLGNVCFEQCDYPKALKYFFKALEIDEELGEQQPIAARLGNIGGVYLRLGDHAKALDYYFKALKIDETLGDKSEISPDLNNIGIIYYDQHSYTKALEYSFRALRIDEDLGNKNWMASRLGTIGNIYSDMSESPKLGHSESDSLSSKALKYYFKALAIYEELDNKSGMAIQLGNIGAVYVTAKRYKEAEAYFKKVLNIDTLIGFRDHTQNTLLQLSVLYERTSQPIKALEFYKQYAASRDSVFNVTKSNQIAEMQTKYEVEKKEKELSILKQEKQIAAYKAYFLISTLIFVFLLGILLINRQRIKIKKQKEAHELEQKLVQNELERNKLEKLNLENDLLLKQEKLVSSTNLIKEKTRLLDKMQQEMEEMKDKNQGTEQAAAEHLFKTFKENIAPEQYWEEFITNFNLVYKEFFQNLTVKFPDLTRSELKHCALIKCNLGNKEIANVLHISPDSVKKSRNRMRKKLKLEADDNLTKYISLLN